MKPAFLHILCNGLLVKKYITCMTIIATIYKLNLFKAPRIILGALIRIREQSLSLAGGQYKSENSMYSKHNAPPPTKVSNYVLAVHYL